SVSALQVRMQRKHGVCAACGKPGSPAFTSVDAANVKFAACARRGVTCQIKSGAKHLVAIPNPLAGIANRTITFDVLASSLSLSSPLNSGVILQFVSPILSCCRSEPLSEIGLTRAACRVFRLPLGEDF